MSDRKIDPHFSKQFGSEVQTSQGRVGLNSYCDSLGLIAQMQDMVPIFLSNNSLPTRAQNQSNLL